MHPSTPNRHRARNLSWLEYCGSQIPTDTLAQVFSCEFCEVSKSAFFTEQLCAASDMSDNQNDHFDSEP